MLCLWSLLLGARPVPVDGSDLAAPLLADLAGQQALAGSVDPLRLNPASRDHRQSAEPDGADHPDGWPGTWFTVLCAVNLAIARPVAPVIASCQYPRSAACRLPVPRGPPTV